MSRPVPPIAALATFLALAGICQAADSGAASQNAGPALRAADSAPVTPPMTAAEVIRVLDQTVDWYRTLGTQQQVASEPADMLILYDNRLTASKVMTLAFDIARADADMLGMEPLAAQDSGGDGAVVSSQTLAQLRTKMHAQRLAIQAELDSQRKAAAAKSDVDVQAKINELQGELDLVNTKTGVLDTMAGFTTVARGNSAGALREQIDAMAIALPATTSPAPPNPAAAASMSPSPSIQSLLGSAGGAASVVRFGLWDMASNVFRLSEKAAAIASIDRRTAALQATLLKIRTPLLEQINRLSARGDALAAAAATGDSATLNGVHDQLDALAAQFKQLSALLIPLSQESILLAQYRRNLNDWRDAIAVQSHAALDTLGVRLVVVLLVLAALFSGAELWRRTVLRYIQDFRRRYQLLLLRRIALWSLVVLIIGISFASELGSVVTFAGLITAGVAVAMQSVLVSIVGYFFLIGKYGIRVGDRVQIGDVAGEVIDLGLVRMYLMELGAKGATGPTGRVVAFANSVVFQVSSGLFKQIPGVNLTWREVTLNLPPGADYAAIKIRLTTAVTDALKDYRAEILRQTREIELNTQSASAGNADPQVQLQFSAGAVEAHVRYPVHLGHAAEIDEGVTEALAAVVANLTPR